MRISEVMTRNVRTVDQHEPIERAAAAMHLGRIHHLVVVHGQRLVGLVSSEMLERGAAEGIARVEDVRLRHVPVAAPDLTISQAANLLRGRTAGALPVVDHEQLVGIITVSDLLGVLGRGAERPPARSRRRTLAGHNGRVAPAQCRAE
ncbi:MAG: CBS domain-containing protein [Vicinamibacterales bacterium]